MLSPILLKGLYLIDKYVTFVPVFPLHCQPSRTIERRTYLYITRVLTSGPHDTNRPGIDASHTK